MMLDPHLTQVSLYRGEPGLNVSDVQDRSVVRVRDQAGKVCYIARSHVAALKGQGWRGTDQIPAECIIEDA
jgi:hypothetical protein